MKNIRINIIYILNFSINGVTDDDDDDDSKNQLYT